MRVKHEVILFFNILQSFENYLKKLISDVLSLMK